MTIKQNNLLKPWLFFTDLLTVDILKIVKRGANKLIIKFLCHLPEWIAE